MSCLYRLRVVFTLTGVVIGILIGASIASLLGTAPLGGVQGVSTPSPTSVDEQSAHNAPVSVPAHASQDVPTPHPLTTSSPEPIPPRAVLTPAPTTAPSVAPTPTIVPTTDPVTTLLAWVVEAETTVQRGHLEATLLSPEGARTASTVRFDLGDARQMPRFQSSTTYESAGGTQTVEQIMVGAQAWQRQPDGRWVEVADQAGIWDQLQPFMPYVAAAAQPELRTDDRTATLQWYDAGRDADVTLVVDRANGIPRTLRRATRATGGVLTVTYGGWNTAVKISPPAGN